VVAAHCWTVSTVAENKTEDFERNENRKIKILRAFLKIYSKIIIHALKERSFVIN
jgi:hypothetical protein